MKSFKPIYGDFNYLDRRNILSIVFTIVGVILVSKLIY